MPKLTAESFLSVLKQSGLLDKEHIKRLVVEAQQAGVNIQDSDSLAVYFTQRELLTQWQVDKLQQGKHKGFTLGKYRLMRLLGKGGMSSVYLAEHVLMRRRCAIKVLPIKRVNDSSYLARFHREAQAVASLDHPNIVRAYDIDHEVEKDTEIHFLVMEYVSGRSLQEIIKEDGPLSVELSAAYMAQAAIGLDHAHKAGLVHRDVKPGNLLVDLGNVVKLLDLGLALFSETTEENPLTVTHDEKVLGTADYLSPEQALDSHLVDLRADIYSLGCTIYFCLTGHPPFKDGTLTQRLMWHQTKDPIAVNLVRPDIPESFVAIVAQMMAKKPADRFQTMAHVADALLGWLHSYASPEFKHQFSNLLSGSGINSGSGTKLRVTTQNAAPNAFIPPVAAVPVVPPLVAMADVTPTTPAPMPTPAVELPFVAPGELEVDSGIGDFLKTLQQTPVSVQADFAPTVPTQPAPAIAAPVVMTAPQTPQPVVAAMPWEVANQSTGSAQPAAHDASSGVGVFETPQLPVAAEMSDTRSFAVPANSSAAPIAVAAPVAAVATMPVAAAPMFAAAAPAQPIVASAVAVAAAPMTGQATPLAAAMPVAPTSVMAVPVAYAGQPPVVAQPISAQAVATPAASTQPIAASVVVPEHSFFGAEETESRDEAVYDWQTPTAAPAPIVAAMPVAAPVGQPSWQQAAPAVPVAMTAMPAGYPVTGQPVENQPVFGQAYAAPLAGEQQVPGQPFPNQAYGQPVAAAVAVAPAPIASKKPFPIKLVGIVAVVVLAGGVGAFMALSPSGDAKPSKEKDPSKVANNDGGKPKKGTGKVVTNSAGSPAREPAPKAAPEPMKPITTKVIDIGPEGHFKEIWEALSYVSKEKRKYAATSSRGRPNVTLAVAGGKTYEAFAIDNGDQLYPSGIHIIARGARAKLNPRADGLCVRLLNVENFRLENFDLDAGGKDSAIEVIGYTTPVFGKLSVSGFAKTGIAAQGLAADGSEAIIQEVEFRPANDAAVGIRFSKSLTNTRYVTVKACRFIGPMKAGIECTSGAQQMQFRENIFDQTDVGVSFAAESAWKFILLGNNTFVGQKDAAIVFAGMPTDGTENLVIQRNVFVKGAGPELRVEKGFQQSAMETFIYSRNGEKGLEANFTDRKVAADEAKGEFEIITDAKQRGVDVSFVSTDSKNPDYYMLAGNSPAANVPNPSAALMMQPFSGARPKK